MKLYSWFNIALLFFLVSCSQKVPEPSAEYGILVVPTIAKSPNKKGFTHRYVFHLNDEPESSFIITPNVSRTYVMVNDLNPGIHTITQMSGIGRRNATVRARSRKLPQQPMSIEFSIEPGAITILNQGFFVKSNVIRKHKFPNDSWRFHQIPSSVYSEILEDLKAAGYIPSWRVSGNAINGFAMPQ